MNIGDLVIRVFCDRNDWGMFGIIIDKNYEVKNSGGAELIYKIFWSGPGVWASNSKGHWKEHEVELVK